MQNTTLDDTPSTDPDVHYLHGQPVTVSAGRAESVEARAADLLDMIVRRRPAWHNRAACAGAGNDLFFSDDPADLAHARDTFCAVCPVSRECSEAGANEVGMWGGVNRKETMLAVEKKASDIVDFVTLNPFKVTMRQVQQRYSRHVALIRQLIAEGRIVERTVEIPVTRDHYGRTGTHVRTSRRLGPAEEGAA